MTHRSPSGRSFVAVAVANAVPSLGLWCLGRRPRRARCLGSGAGGRAASVLVSTLGSRVPEGYPMARSAVKRERARVRAYTRLMEAPRRIEMDYRVRFDEAGPAGCCAAPATSATRRTSPGSTAPCTASTARTTRAAPAVAGPLRAAGGRSASVNGEVCRVSHAGDRCATRVGATHRGAQARRRSITRRKPGRPSGTPGSWPPSSPRTGC